LKTKGAQVSHVAVLDANPVVLRYVQSILADRLSLSLFTDPSELFSRLQEPASVDLLLMDWLAVGGNGNGDRFKSLVKIRTAKPLLPIILLARAVDLKDVVTATRLGATDVLPKPFSKNDLELAIEHWLSTADANSGARQDQVREIPLDEDTSFVFCSRRMHELESQCRLVARTDIPVLILGESGTGKEVATLHIHKMSARSRRSFLKVNCAAMPADLLESELFGYEQGAFTGAVKSKPGKFELCNGGTIFLDEIGEMPAALQAKFLQVLQDGTFARLGGRYTVKVDVRVIAATNLDIKDAIAQRMFREDLYYRLNGFTLRMPPLRERIEEIPILAHYFMRKVAAKYCSDPLTISPTLMQVLCTHSWPGNLRELENIIKRYFILRDEISIINDLHPGQLASPSAPAGENTISTLGLKSLVRSVKGDAESLAIAQALEETGWNRKAAANELQISYKALLYKIKQYNLSRSDRQTHMIA
jgi:DNA-binding NtrC family response regulator